MNPAHAYRAACAALLILVAVQVTSCEKPSAKISTKPASRPTPVMIATVEREALHAKNTIVGTLNNPRQIQIFNQEEGQIIHLPYYEGDRVTEGDVLVQLEADVIRAQLIKAVAERRQATLDLSRMEKLLARNATSQDEVARARTALELARAEEDLRRIMLARTTIRASFNGIISERLKEPGDLVATHTHILTLIDPSILYVDVHVSELLLPDLNIGDAVEIRVDALRDHVYAGHIMRIHPIIDSDTRQGTVEVELKPVPEGALPGQLARVTFNVQKTVGLIIPFASLRRDTTGTYVYRVDNETIVRQYAAHTGLQQHQRNLIHEGIQIARRVAVRTGLQLGNKIEILEGLQEGEQVVISGLLNLRDGRAIRIVDKNESPPKPDI